MATLSTKDKALNEAMSLMQARGFNGFSFQHIADALGIKKPSLYDHFSSKDELGVELIKRHRERIEQWTETIVSFNPEDQIKAYFKLFNQLCADGKKLCPLGALSSDYNSLSTKMQKELTVSFENQVDWLKKIILEGQKKKIFRADLSAELLAQTVQSSSLGAQKLGRISGDPRDIDKVRDSILKLIKV